MRCAGKPMARGPATCSMDMDSSAVRSAKAKTSADGGWRSSAPAVQGARSGLRRLQRLQPTSVCVNRAERVHHELPSMAHLPAERCLAIIELLADGARDMPLGEIAERLALPKSGAHRLLATLVDIGWAEKDPS